MKVLRHWVPFLNDSFDGLVRLAGGISDLHELYRLSPALLLTACLGVAALRLQPRQPPRAGSGTREQIADRIKKLCPDRFEQLRHGALISMARRHVYPITRLDLENCVVWIEGPSRDLCTELAASRVTFQFAGIDGILQSTATAVDCQGHTLLLRVTQMDVPPRLTDTAVPTWTGETTETDAVLIHLLAEKWD